MRERRGVFLIEMAVVIVCAAVVLATATWVLCALMHTSSAVQRECGQTATIARLAEQFRRDAHAALKLTPPAADRQAWIFELGPEASVEYVFSGNELLRRERSAGQVQGRQPFRLPADTLTEIELLAGESPAAVRLSILPAPDRPAGPRPVCITVNAILAKDHRFEKQRK